MARKDATAIVSGAGWIGSFADKLIHALREKGVSDEQIRQLATERCGPPIEKIAHILVQEFHHILGYTPVVVDYSIPLKDVIVACRFSVVSKGIMENLLISQVVAQKGKVEVRTELSHYDKNVEFAVFVSDLQERNLRLANLHEALAYCQKNHGCSIAIPGVMTEKGMLATNEDDGAWLLHFADFNHYYFPVLVVRVA